MLTYDLNARGRLPIYEYLYSCIREDILSGVLPGGTRLPSKRTLARHLNVGVVTVANAYLQLATEGYIRPEEKRGYFVQDLSHYERRTHAPALPQGRAEGEQTYYADFRANRTSLRMFPAAKWNYYMREALSLQDDSLYKTVPYQGLYSLRRAIADYLARNRGLTVSPDQIIIGAGTEYLYGRLLQLLGRACILGMEDPGYKKFAAISRAYGNICEYIAIDENGMRADALEESGADVIHISPSNHFPTGIIMPVTRRVELFEWVNKAKKRYIIEDDYDSEFRYSGHYLPPMYAQDTQNKVIYMNTFSKSLVPSLRISYMILPPALLQKYEETMSFYSCTVSSFEQYALGRFIADGCFERHLSRMKNYYRRQRIAILDAIAASPLSAFSEVLERSAGTHFLLRVHTALTEAEIRAAASAAGLSVSMYSDYSSARSVRETQTLVINYAAIEPGQLQQVVERLGMIFPEYGA